MRLFSSLAFFLFISSQVFAADLKGSVQFNGTAPAPKKIDTKSDPSCGSGSVPAEEVVVNPNGTLKNVFVYVKEGLPNQKLDPPAQSVTLDQRGCQYLPHVFGLQTGQNLEILNSDSTLHNIHGMPAKSKQFNLGMPLKGMKLKRKFDQPEVMVRLKCDVHPWMSAYAGVLPHSFFAVTDENGNFEIKNLPAGTYTLEAWHEKFGTQKQQITVDSSGAKSADFSFKG